MSEIKGYESLMAKLNKLTGSQIDEVANNSVKNVSLAHARAAKLLAPVGIRGGGEQKSSIHTKNEKDATGATGYCYSDSDHAAYVEFGTGPVGEAFGGNGSDLKVSYAQGPWKHKYRAKGGGTQELEKDYWVYMDEDGKFHATRGMRARPFMYPSAMVVKKQAPEIQARVLKTYLKKLGV